MHSGGLHIKDPHRTKVNKPLSQRIGSIVSCWMGSVIWSHSFTLAVLLLDVNLYQKTNTSSFSHRRMFFLKTVHLRTHHLSEMVAFSTRFSSNMTSITASAVASAKDVSCRSIHPKYIVLKVGSYFIANTHRTKWDIRRSQTFCHGNNIRNDIRMLKSKEFSCSSPATT